MILFLKVKYYLQRLFLAKSFLLFIVSFFGACCFLAALFFYEVHEQERRIRKILQQEASKIENLILEKFDHTYDVIKKMNAQIVKNPHDKQRIYQIITTFESQQRLSSNLPWTIFSWTNSNNQIIVDAVYGVMKEPFDLSVRDYIHLTKSSPDIFYLGVPVFGSTSKKWMIPGGVGVYLNKKYLGSMTIGFEIEILSEMIHELIDNRNVSFTLLDLGNMPILHAKSSSYGNCKEQSCYIDIKTIEIISDLKFNEDIHQIHEIDMVTRNSARSVLAKELEKYPYILLLEYDQEAMRQELIKSYKTKIKITTILAILLLSLILSYRLVFI